MPVLTAAQYGKANIRVLKVDRDKNGVHTPRSLNVTVQLEGDIDASYTAGDNTSIVATDSQKQSVYILARIVPVWPPERFAVSIAGHFLAQYSHLSAATVTVVQESQWDRIRVPSCVSSNNPADDSGSEPGAMINPESQTESSSNSGSGSRSRSHRAQSSSQASSDESSTCHQPHPHSFFSHSTATPSSTAVVRRHPTEPAKGLVDITSSLTSLRLLKTTGSAFHSFIRDDYTRLPETNDRVLATRADVEWAWNQSEIELPTFAATYIIQNGSRLNAPGAQAPSLAPLSLGTPLPSADVFQEAATLAHDRTTSVFAIDESPSVQSTMYKIASAILDGVPDIRAVTCVLPNDHHFEIDLSWFCGLDNTSPKAESKVYATQTDPNGLIKCTVERGDDKK